jgi:tRNA threonylcarbamoyladenosine biosynthesis protein TsaB
LFQEYDNREIYFVGNGVTKWENLISEKCEKLHFFDSYYPSSEGLAYLSAKSFHSNQFENLAYFEPSYLKDFIAGTSEKNKLI